LSFLNDGLATRLSLQESLAQICWFTIDFNVFFVLHSLLVFLVHRWSTCFFCFRLDGLLDLVNLLALVGDKAIECSSASRNVAPAFMLLGKGKCEKETARQV
jgi:hypothetical protein